MQPVVEDLLTQMLSTLEDDNKSTRVASCRVLAQLFSSYGDLLDQDRLHNVYPKLLKRLDDSSDDIRVEVTCTFSAYFAGFKVHFAKTVSSVGHNSAPLLCNFILMCYL